MERSFKSWPRIYPLTSTTAGIGPDTDIARHNGKYYRFSKDEKFKAITMEVSDKLMGDWQDVPGSRCRK